MSRGISLRWRITTDAWLACVAFGLSLAFYLPTLSPSVVAGDGGELQMLAAVLGVPHPTGYPLFTLLGWMFTRLPLGGDAALRVTLFGAIAAAAGAGLAYLAARELRLGRFSALMAALLLAAAPRVWMHAAATEVYPLANLFILLAIWLLLRWGAGKTPLWGVALALGFGLTHHISLRLFGPAMLVYLLLVDARLLLQPRRWLPALACLLLPLALYVYLPLRADYFVHLPQWSGDILGVPKVVAAGLVSPHYVGGGFWNLVLTLDYSGQFFGGQAAGLGKVVVQFLEMLRQQFPLSAVPLMVLGVGVLARRHAKANWLFVDRRCDSACPGAAVSGAGGGGWRQFYSRLSAAAVLVRGRRRRDVDMAGRPAGALVLAARRAHPGPGRYPPDQHHRPLSGHGRVAPGRLGPRVFGAAPARRRRARRELEHHHRVALPPTGRRHPPRPVDHPQRPRRRGDADATGAGRGPAVLRAASDTGRSKAAAAACPGHDCGNPPC